MMRWILLVIFCSLLGGTAQILFKKFPLDFGSMEAILTNWGLFIGFFLYGLAFIFYLVALRHLPVTTAYPLIGLSYLVTMILASLFLSESLSVQKIIGAIGLIGCVWLMVL